MVDPVKATLRMSGCAEMAAPAVGPYPGTTFTTPGGNPACQCTRQWQVTELMLMGLTSLMSAAMYRAVSGVCSAGFITMTLPVASAGAILNTYIIAGKFH